MIKYVVPIITAVFSGMLIGCNAERNLKKGDRYYALGEYYEASVQYKLAYSKTPPKEREKRGERAYKLADCYRRINYTAKAIGAYQNAVRYKYTDTLTYFYLAEMQRRNGDYRNAAKNYALHLETHPGEQRAEIGLESCRLAPEWKKNGSLYTVKEDRLFNSRRADYCPMLTGTDFNQLYITSTRPQATGDEDNAITGTKNGDLFRAEKDDKGKWKQPELVDGEVNSAYDEGACAFSSDGSTMYFTRCRVDPQYPRMAEIWSSNRSDATWSKPQACELSGDTLSSYAHPAVSADGRWLYFVSDMPGGMGGYDLWRVELTSNGFGPVENLGESINTEGDELFPTCRPTGELYFSTDGRIGMGGLDLYSAVEDTVTGRWKVTHLPYPMNSQADDFGMTFEGLHNRGYFSSNRGNGKGWDKIYRFECPEILQTVKGWVYEQDGYELPEALVYMIGNDGTNERLSVKSDGSFEHVIQPDVDYLFLATCKGFLNYRQSLRVDSVTKSQEYVLQFPLPSITAPVLVRNVFYAFDSAELTDDSRIALDRLVTLLKENPNVTIELSAHCDYRGEKDYNRRLSQRRSESVVNYLIEHGVEKERLTAKGYGEESPKVVTKKLAESYPFLHLGDTLTETRIKLLPNEADQEACNALNRRTEFKVLRTTYGLFDEKGNLKPEILIPKKEEKKDSEVIEITTES